MSRLELLLPVPKRLTSLGGRLVLPTELSVRLIGATTLPALDRLEQTLEKRGLTPVPAHSGEQATIELMLGGSGEPQSYRLRADAGRVRIEAPDAAGLFYGVCTLEQLIEISANGDGRARVPAVSIEDAPDFGQRGVMLDVSRDKVPTMQTLFDLVERLASVKINQLQLYVEHTFAYAGHENVWRESSPFTSEEMKALDAFCRERHIELVPNQNSFGHMHRWLVHEPYRSLAECPEGFEHPWNPTKEPYSLCAVDPKSLELVGDLYDQLLPNFSSSLFNVGCDETIDLGLGRSKEACESQGTERVYLDYLQKIHGLVRERGRRMQFWGDIIIKRPELIPELPADAIAMEWGYEKDHPFAEHLEKFSSAGLEFYVCPGTSSWNSIAGRTHNALGNIKNAIRTGLEHGASGVLNTDWGDNGHLQPLCVSYLGLLAGAALSWNAASNVDERDLMGDLLDLHCFGDKSGKLGRLAYDLGNAYRDVGTEPHNNSALFMLLMAGDKTDAFEGLSPEALARARSRVTEIKQELERPDRQNGEVQRGRAELHWAARMLEFCCDLGQARLDGEAVRPLAEIEGGRRAALAHELGALIEEHRKLWLGRNRPGGLADSVARLERTRVALAPDPN
ncbi:MAG TPA: family 20 glycosylhydrolase [Polyangiaceae bacterium]|nr:family 20 glycosylhydrolase [Polyangiaceae bacterium]